MLTICGICVIATVVDYLIDATTWINPIKTTLGVFQLKFGAIFSGVKLLLMFSFYTNGAEMLDTTPTREGHLRSVDCIRFLSMLWVVSGHVMELWLLNGCVLCFLIRENSRQLVRSGHCR